MNSHSVLEPDIEPRCGGGTCQRYRTEQATRFVRYHKLRHLDHVFPVFKAGIKLEKNNRAEFLDSTWSVCIISGSSLHPYCSSAVPKNPLDFVKTPASQAVVWVSVLVVMLIVAYYVVRRFRDSSEEDEINNELLTKFREMRQRGDLSDVEYRTIKTVLVTKFQNQLKREDQSD